MALDQETIKNHLLNLLAIDSPTGRTQRAATWIVEQFERLGIAVETTRRGAVRAVLPATNPQGRPALAMAAHLDTLGAMVIGHWPNGRALMTPLGSLSARMVEGARVRLETRGGALVAGTVLPIKASGHRFGLEVEQQPVSWDNLELRLDITADWQGDTQAVRETAQVGDYVFFDTEPSLTADGLIKARFIDNQAGAAILLALAETLIANETPRERDLHLLFSVTEEIGTGGAHLLLPEIGDLIAVDIAVNAPGQNSSAMGATLVHKDKGGPYDFDLTRRLTGLCEQANIEHRHDVFRHYFSDTQPATAAGFDCRMALVCYACEATHGHERSHFASMEAVAKLLHAAALQPQL